MASLMQDALDYAAEQTQQALAALGSSTTKETTVWMDGAFDVMHFGHANAFRQGRTLGTRLVVGVNSSSTIERAKGAPPLLTDEERCAAVKACRFVDDVVPHVPYVMNEAYVRDLLENKGIDYIVHGDDPCIVDGKDVYQAAKDLGRYKTIPRTEGVSTTDLVGRLLRLDDTARAFLGTARIQRDFSHELRAPQPDERVVYVAGAWDLFHPGHSKFLEACRACGDYLLVGVHGDECVKERRGRLPLMNLQERVLSVLACRHVDDVLIDAPSIITPELLSTFRVSTVCHGGTAPPGAGAKARKVASPSPLNSSMLAARVEGRREQLLKRHRKKAAAEAEWYAGKDAARA